MPGRPVAPVLQRCEPPTLEPTERPLRPLCPSCGAERVIVTTTALVRLHVVGVDALGRDLQVVRHEVEDPGWSEDDRAACDACGWSGLADDLRPAGTA